MTLAKHEKLSRNTAQKMSGTNANIWFIKRDRKQTVDGAAKALNRLVAERNLQGGDDLPLHSSKNYLHIRMFRER